MSARASRKMSEGKKMPKGRKMPASADNTIKTKNCHTKACGSFFMRKNANPREQATRAGSESNPLGQATRAGHESGQETCQAAKRRRSGQKTLFAKPLREKHLPNTPIAGTAPPFAGTARRELARIGDFWRTLATFGGFRRCVMRNRGAGAKPRTELHKLSAYATRSYAESWGWHKTADRTT